MMVTRWSVTRSASRMRAMHAAWPAKSPCEKLSRATFIPARIRRSSISGESEAGPIVATILVLWSGKDITTPTSSELAPRSPTPGGLLLIDDVP